jgi:7-carboxy-7-deazaguanine synthase
MPDILDDTVSDFCYLQGYWLGDGFKTLSNLGYSVRDSKEYCDNLRNRVARVLGYSPKSRYEGGSSCSLYFYKDTRALKNLIISDIQRKSILFKAPWDFVAGFLDSDGWVSYWNTKGSDQRVISICFTNTNMDYLLLLGEVLDVLHIPYTIRMGNKHHLQNKPCWDLEIATNAAIYVVATHLRDRVFDVKKKDRFDDFIQFFRDIHLKQTLPICETFVGLQGEGTNTGSIQFFIRASTCDMKCKICDSKYSWGKGTKKTLQEIVLEVSNSGVSSVCLTGGEIAQFRNKLGGLVAFLREKGIHIVLQTNGLHYNTYFKLIHTVSMDAKTPSTGEKSNLDLILKLDPKDEVKTLISDRRDYEYAIKVNEKVKQARCRQILQPLNLVGQDNTQDLIDKLKWIGDLVLSDRRWYNVRVLPQVHVLLWGNKRGV